MYFGIATPIDQGLAAIVGIPHLDSTIKARRRDALAIRRTCYSIHCTSMTFVSQDVLVPHGRTVAEVRPPQIESVTQ
jgi:hypothetical protein